MEFRQVRETAEDLVHWLTMNVRAALRAITPKTGARGEPILVEIRPSTRAKAPSLRPPTLMIDLLFGALMLFAFQMGDPNSRPIVPQEFDLPTADRDVPEDQAILLALKPIRGAEGAWRYELADGRQLAPDEVAPLLTKQNATPVLLVPSSAPVQAYLDAEQPLRQRGLKVGLAVATEGSRP